jgi:hypothetical protein
MFHTYTIPNYFPRSAHEIEAEGREREKRMDLERAIESEVEAKRTKKNLFGLLATILFS